MRYAAPDELRSGPGQRPRSATAGTSSRTHGEGPRGHVRTAPQGRSAPRYRHEGAARHVRVQRTGHVCPDPHHPRTARPSGEPRMTVTMPVTQAPTTRAQLRILIVEDHMLFAESLELVLSVEGYDVRRITVPDNSASPGTLLSSLVRLRP